MFEAPSNARVNLSWHVQSSAETLRRLSFACAHTFATPTSILHSPAHRNRARLVINVPHALTAEVRAIMRAAVEFVSDDELAILEED